MKTIGDMGGVMTTLAMVTTGMSPRLPGPAGGVSGAGGAGKVAPGTAGSPKKLAAANKKQDTLLMDTKLKIVEILEVGCVLFRSSYSLLRPSHAVCCVKDTFLSRAALSLAVYLECAPGLPYQLPPLHV